MPDVWLPDCESLVHMLEAMSDKQACKANAMHSTCCCRGQGRPGRHQSLGVLAQLGWCLCQGDSAQLNCCLVHLGCCCQGVLGTC